MRELFEICPKIQFFNFFGAFLALRGVNSVGKGVKCCVLMCQGQPGKLPCLSPDKMIILPHLALFFHLSLPKIWHSHPLKITCLKVHELNYHHTKFYFNSF